jgi:hypothetical protein
VVVADVVGEPATIGIVDVVAVHADPVDDADAEDVPGWYGVQEIAALIGGN